MHSISINKNEWSFRLLRGIVLFFSFITIIIPLFVVFVYAFNISEMIEKGNFSFYNSIKSFMWLFERLDVTTGLRNSLLRSILTPFATCFFSFLASYVIAMSKTIYSKVFYYFVVFSLYFIVGPLFSYMNMSKFGLNNSFAPYVFPYLINSLYIIILSSFIRGIPKEYAESARVFGATEIRIALSIYLPLMKSSLAAVYLLCFIIHWNDYVDTLLYNFSTPDLYTLQYMGHAYLNNTIASTSQHGSAFQISMLSVKMAMNVLLILPVLFLVPLMKKTLFNFLQEQ